MESNSRLAAFYNIYHLVQFLNFCHLLLLLPIDPCTEYANGPATVNGGATLVAGCDTPLVGCGATLLACCGTILIGCGTALVAYCNSTFIACDTTFIC